MFRVNHITKSSLAPSYSTIFLEMKRKTFILKLVSAIFYQIFIFNQIIDLQKLWKMFFISSKKLFSLSRYSIFVFPSSPLFLPVSHCLGGWSKINFNVYDVINCLNKNLVTHFACDLGEKSYDIIMKLCPLIEY